MPKTIVFCADGTWNGPGAPDQDEAGRPPTNVLKLFLNLQGTDAPGTIMLAKEQERTLTQDGTIRQAAKYIDGVGDSSNFLVRLLGGALGAGLITRVIRGYTFISRAYRDGDQVFIVGFSRGAYTARAVSGLINNQGLLDATRHDLEDKELGYRLGAAAWYAWRRTVHPGDWLAALEAFAVDLPGFFIRPVAVLQRIPAPVRAVAVWETVGALGIPEYTVKTQRVDLLQFADTALCANVQIGLQGLAVDEKRADLTPTLWDADARVTQVLFPGAHGDVGGGEPADESGLSDCALVWLTQALSGLGVRFASVPPPGAPDSLAMAHTPWKDLPWSVLAQASRGFPAGMGRSASLRDRLADGPVKAGPGCAPALYQPGNLPAEAIS